MIKKTIGYLKQHGIRKTLTRVFFELNQIRKEGLNSSIKRTDPGYVAAIDLFDDENYKLWIEQNEPDIDSINKQKELSRRFELKPKISIITPVFNPDKKVFIEMIESVINQTYDNLELCLADASTKPYVKEIIEGYIKKGEARIGVKYLEQNKGIVGNSNEAISLATGDYIALLDHDDTLAPFAFFEIVKTINEHPDVEFIYSDRDVISYSGQRFYPFFKPDWSPDYLLSQNYLCHLNVFKKSLIDKIGGFRADYEGSQDYDFLLRATELTDKIFHIPKILYHWRIVLGSASIDPEAKPYAYDAAIKALSDAIHRRGLEGTVTHGEAKGFYDLRLRIKDNPKVSIIVAAEDNPEALKRCIRSILDRMTYKNYEIVIVGNQGLEKETSKHFDDRDDISNIKLLKLDRSFNVSEIYNLAVSQVDADYIIFLKDDTEILTANWIELMLGFAQRRETGAVGGKVVYPDGTIQSAGLILDERGNIRRAHHGFPKGHRGHNGRIHYVHNVSAVSGVCLMVRRKLFNAVGGFDTRFNEFRDVDFCLTLRERNYLIIYEPHVEVCYHETPVHVDKPERLKIMRREKELFLIKWGKILKNGDPYYSPHLTTEKEDFSIKL